MPFHWWLFLFAFFLCSLELDNRRRRLDDRKTAAPNWTYKRPNERNLRLKNRREKKRKFDSRRRFDGVHLGCLNAIIQRWVHAIFDRFFFLFFFSCWSFYECDCNRSINKSTSFDFKIFWSSLLALFLVRYTFVVASFTVFFFFFFFSYPLNLKSAKIGYAFSSTL